MVRFANLLTSDNHAAGRTGLGAVMGSKMMKAVAVARSPQERSERRNGLAALVRDYALSIRQSERYDLYSTTGNSAYLNWTNDLGLLGTRNYQSGQFEHAAQTGRRPMEQVRHPPQNLPPLPGALPRRDSHRSWALRESVGRAPGHRAVDGFWRAHRR